jgi:hypothetical protein
MQIGALNDADLQGHNQWGDIAGHTHDMKAIQKKGSQIFGHLICNYQVGAVSRKKYIN